MMTLVTIVGLSTSVIKGFCFLALQQWSVSLMAKLRTGQHWKRLIQHLPANVCYCLMCTVFSLGWGESLGWGYKYIQSTCIESMEDIMWWIIISSYCTGQRPSAWFLMLHSLIHYSSFTYSNKLSRSREAYEWSCWSKEPNIWFNSGVWVSRGLWTERWWSSSRMSGYRNLVWNCTILPM